MRVSFQRARCSSDLQPATLSRPSVSASDSRCQGRVNSIAHRRQPPPAVRDRASGRFRPSAPVPTCIPVAKTSSDMDARRDGALADIIFFASRRSMRSRGTATRTYHHRST